MDYNIARPHTVEVTNYLDETFAEWREVALSLMDFMSDDDVGEWMRINGYYFVEEE